MSKLRHRESWYSRTKKELEEMDYKEKYEKALEWMKSVYSTMQGSDKEDAEHYFPELKESEDERMIDGLQGFLSAFGSDFFGTGGWQKFDDWLERQKEQKSEWSEEDENYLGVIVRLVEQVSGWPERAITEYTNWLKSLRPQSHWKPSEAHLSALLAIFNDPDNIGSQTCQLALTDLYEQLKKL